MKSIIQTDRDHCYLCGKHRNAANGGLHEHHVYGGFANRKISEKYGLKVYLCGFDCHEDGENSVHVNEEVNLRLKADVQRKAIDHYGWTTVQFIKLIGRNYISQKGE